MLIDELVFSFKGRRFEITDKSSFLCRLTFTGNLVYLFKFPNLNLRITSIEKEDKNISYKIDYKCSGSREVNLYYSTDENFQLTDIYLNEEYSIILIHNNFSIQHEKLVFNESIFYFVHLEDYYTTWNFDRTLNQILLSNP